MRTFRRCASLWVLGFVPAVCRTGERFVGCTGKGWISTFQLCPLKTIFFGSHSCCSSTFFFKIKKIYCTNILDHCCFVGIVYFTARESAMLYSSDRTKIKVPYIEGTVKLHDLVILHLPILVICVNFSKSIELRKKCSVVGSISFPLMLILFPPLLKIAFPSYIVI